MHDNATPSLLYKSKRNNKVEDARSLLRCHQDCVGLTVHKFDMMFVIHVSLTGSLTGAGGGCLKHTQ